MACGKGDEAVGFHAPFYVQAESWTQSWISFSKDIQEVQKKNDRNNQSKEMIEKTGSGRDDLVDEYDGDLENHGLIGDDG